jgi:hypothetical protein
MMAFIVALSEGIVGKVFAAIQSKADWISPVKLLTSGVVGFVLSYLTGLNFFPFSFGRILTALIPLAGVSLIDKYIQSRYDLAFYQAYLGRQKVSYFITDAACCEDFPCECDLPQE